MISVDSEGRCIADVDKSRRRSDTINNSMQECWENSVRRLTVPAVKSLVTTRTTLGVFVRELEPV